MYNYNLSLKFEEIVIANADKCALKFPSGKNLTYKEYNSLANKFARYLIEIGIKKNDLIWISSEKNLTNFVAILSCIKTGIIYSIFDDESPKARLKKIYNTCNPKVILSSKTIKLEILNYFIKKDSIGIDNEENSFKKKINKYSEKNLIESKEITGDDPIYVMFTSGSTGFPKGATITNSNLLNFIEWCKITFEITNHDVATNLNPLYFDNSVFDFYSTLFNGATLVPFEKKLLLEPLNLINLIEKMNCTQWFSVPSLIIYFNTMRVFQNNGLSKMKRIIFGGEGFPKEKLRNLYQLYKNRINFINVYGPTECTCICSAHTISDEDFSCIDGLPTLGKIAENFDYIILSDKRVVSSGQKGELCLKGPCVGKGYYNDKNQTDLNFIQNPINKSYKDIIYKTGDIVWEDPTNNYVNFYSRKDNQIKHMGYRIELGEIETAANSLKYVIECVASHLNKKNISYIYLSIATNIKVTELKIKADLRKKIPEYMVPSKIIFYDYLPKNSNGKIDKIKINKLLN